MKDKFTGKPILDFQVWWLFIGSEETDSTTSGGQPISQGIRRAIVPPEKYLLLTISASGYKEWIYHDPSDPYRPGFIRWEPAEEKELLVELEPQDPVQSSATVVLKVDPKPGVLLPSVKDKLTGEPIISFQVSWEFVDSDSSNSHSGGQTIEQGIKRAIVPPEEYLLLTISASGYKKWIYHDPSDPYRPGFIRWEPAEEKELLVELEPQDPAARYSAVNIASP